MTPAPPSQSPLLAPASLDFWAATQPEHPAIVDEAGALSYAQLADAADRLAWSLAKLGVRSGERLCVRTRIRREWFVVDRALGKLGCEHVGLSWALAPEDAFRIARDAGAVGVFVDDPEPAILLDALAASGARHLITIGQGESFGGLRYEALVSAGRPEHRPSPLFTRLVPHSSGTTGRPRLVDPSLRLADEQLPGQHLRESVMANPPVMPWSRVLLGLPLHHAAAVWTARSAHAVGGTVYGLDPYDVRSALRMIEEHGIHRWSAVPWMLRHLQEFAPKTLAGYNLSSLQMVTVGGAHVPPSVKKWFREVVGEILWEVYGTSEVGMVTYLTPDAQRTRPNSSGLPFDEVHVRIVDQRWRDRVPGAVGDIAVRSPSTVCGYLDGPPFGAERMSTDGYLRTGDVGYLDEDGYLFILGRRSDVIHAAAGDLYPAAIEAVLVGHPDISAAAVIGVASGGREQPKAFVELRPGATPAPDVLLEFCVRRLPIEQRPRTIEFVEHLPRNQMGNVLNFELRGRAQRRSRP